MPVVYSLSDPKGLIFLRIRLLYNLSYSYNRALSLVTPSSGTIKLAHLARAQPPKIKSQNTTYIRSNTSSFNRLIVYIYETALYTTRTASKPSFSLAPP